MSTLLHIKASPRERSYSTKVADAFKTSYLRTHTDSTISTLDVFDAELPSLDGYALDAKYAIFRQGHPDKEQKDAWSRIEAVIETFTSADAYLFSVPMWNFGIPYRLKHYFDVIVQPGYTFTVTPEGEYQGLVTGKKVAAIYSRGGEYPEGSEAAAVDFQKPYLTTILGYIGLTDVASIVNEPTLAAGPETAEAALGKAITAAQQAAADL